jgi:hypothetical protein
MRMRLGGTRVNHRSVHGVDGLTFLPLLHRLMEEDRQKQLAEQKGSLMGWMAGPKPEQAAK